MKSSIPPFYRPSAAQLTCPHRLKFIPLVTSLEWLDGVARQVLWRVQQKTTYQTVPAPHVPEKDQLPVGLGLEWQQRGAISYLPPLIRAIAQRDHTARELSAVIAFGQAVDKEYQNRGLKQQHPPSVLWVEYVDGIPNHEPSFMKHCMLAERHFISGILFGHYTPRSLALTIVDAAQEALAEASNTPELGGKEAA